MHGAACSGPIGRLERLIRARVSRTQQGFSSLIVLSSSRLLHGHTNTTLQSGPHRKLSCYQSTHLTKPDVRHSYGNRAGRRTASCSSPSRARRLAGVGDVVHLRAKVCTGSPTTCVRPIVEVCHRRAATHASLVGRLGEVVCNYAVAHRRRPFDTPGSAQDTAQTTCLFFPDQLNLRSVFRQPKCTG
jgi:hypothetical protein